MILMIDNYDSFTYNLVQILQGLGEEVVVHRNDAITVSQLAALNPKSVIVSPGPGSPKDAGISREVVQHFAGRLPLLGVCLGHQTIGEVFGAKVVRAERIMHGKTSWMHHDTTGLFDGIPSPFEATRYHSLILERDSLPDDFGITSWTEDDEIMGLEHRPTGALGVQFHPESILSIEGPRILENFARL